MTRLLALLAESWRVALTSRAGSAVVVVVTAATCVLVLLTAGRSAATERDVVASIDEAGSRLVVVTSTVPEGGPEATLVDRAGRVGSVEWAIGVGPARDARNAAVPGGEAVALRAFYGWPVPDLALVTGRWPGPDEVVLSVDVLSQLGLRAAAGGLTATDGTRHWDVVGTFRANGVLADLQHIGLTGPEEPAQLGRLYAVAEEPQDVAPVARLLGELAAVEEPDAIAVSTSTQLVRLSEILTGQLGAVARQQATAALVGGLVFIGVALYATTGLRRRDFGRRRALGASRSALVILVIGQCVWPALLGVAGGTAVGFVAVRAVTSTMPPPGFTASVAVLTLLMAAFAAVPAALTAAFRDPVRILRVP